MRRGSIGTRGNAIDLLAVPGAAELLAKSRAHAIGHDDPLGMHCGLSHAEGGHAVALEHRVGGRGAGEEGGAGFPGGVGKQGIKAVARQGRAHLGGVGLRPRRGNIAAVAVQFQAAIAVGGVDHNAELSKLVHRARGEPVAAGFIAGKRRGINKEGVITGACGMNRGGGSGRPSANDGDLDIGLGIDLLRHEDYHCMSSTPRVCLGAQFGLR